MKKSVKKLWLQALRSGEYKQATQALRLNDSAGRASFCCLGVLCNLHAQAHPKIARRETDPTRYLGDFKWLPKNVMEWAGLKDLRGEEVNTPWGGLAKMNDAGKSFKAIASVIEKQL